MATTLEAEAARAMRSERWPSPASVSPDTPMFPVVETAQGRLRGAVYGGIAVFRGVSYGASTQGEGRFMPPRNPPEWSGVRDALSFGDVSPQAPTDRRHAYADLIQMEMQPAGPGEDCLKLNIWTPALSREANRPVVVVLHGGGFFGGSGNSTGMDGEQMARFADCVVVSVTHRLGVLGFAHVGGEVGGGGSDFASSGSVGMQDIVAALRWIAENIAQFGGNPGRVLVYGQSGGGAKTSVLMGMPSAQGLFHSAGVMSGSMQRVMTPERAEEVLFRLLQALDIPPGSIGRLRELPFTALIAAQAGLERADRMAGRPPMGFAPVADGLAIPGQPWDPAAPAVSRDIPLIVSNTRDEQAFMLSDFGLDESGLREFLQARLGGKAGQLLELYREETPTASPYLLKARLITDLTFARAADEMTELKAAEGGAPVWRYHFNWESPAFDGRYGAVHGIDVAPSLHGARGGLTGSGPVARAMADRLAASWALLAARGDPSNPFLPAWPAWDAEKQTVMVLDERPRTESNPRAEIRDLLKDVPDMERLL